MVVSIADVMACTNGQSSKVSSLLAIVIVVMVRGAWGAKSIFPPKHLRMSVRRQDGGVWNIRLTGYRGVNIHVCLYIDNSSRGVRKVARGTYFVRVPPCPALPCTPQPQPHTNTTTTMTMTDVIVGRLPALASIVLNNIRRRQCQFSRIFYVAHSCDSV